MRPMGVENDPIPPSLFQSFPLLYLYSLPLLRGLPYMTSTNVWIFYPRHLSIRKIYCLSANLGYLLIPYPLLCGRHSWNPPCFSNLSLANRRACASQLDRESSDFPNRSIFRAIRRRTRTESLTRAPSNSSLGFEKCPTGLVELLPASS